jgi:hypothetical protein
LKNFLSQLNDIEYSEAISSKLDTPEKLIQVREQLQRERQLALAAGRTPGDASDNN